VVARYAAEKVDLVDTARSGFVAIRFAPESAPHVVERGRIDRHPYWRED
jgi:hypothetical protein